VLTSAATSGLASAAVQSSDALIDAITPTAVTNATSRCKAYLAQATAPLRYGASLASKASLLVPSAIRSIYYQARNACYDTCVNAAVKSALHASKTVLAELLHGRSMIEKKQALAACAAAIKQEFSPEKLMLDAKWNIANNVLTGQHGEADYNWDLRFRLAYALSDIAVQAGKNKIIQTLFTPIAA
jgi:hypothetical protein